METTKPFALALRELAIEHDYATRSRNPNWSALAARLEGVHYETLRRATTGERPPAPRLMEECARIFGLRPEYFLEYRLYLSRRDFDPAAVGFVRALQNLEAWARVRDGVPVRTAPTRPSI
jgi:hypothetical protein